MSKRSRNEFVGVRFTAEDVAAIDAAAKREGMNRSEYVRAACLAYMALRMDRHALNAVLEGAKNMFREFSEEGKRDFFAKKVKV